MPKIFGQTIISRIKKKIISKKFYKNLQSEKCEFDEIFEWNDKLFIDFKNWILNNKINEEYNKLPKFREYWTNNMNLPFLERYYRWILRNITKYFLEAEAYDYFVNCSINNKRFKSETIEEYLKLLPLFYNCIDFPQTLIKLEY